MPNPYRPEFSKEMLEIPRHTPLSISGETILFTWLPFLYPLGLLAAITGTWLLAYLALGAVPKPNINDPKGLSYLKPIYAYEITIILLAGAPGAVLAGLISQFIVFRRSLERRVRLACLLAVDWVACFLI